MHKLRCENILVIAFLQHVNQQGDDIGLARKHRTPIEKSGHFQNNKQDYPTRDLSQRRPWSNQISKNGRCFLHLHVYHYEPMEIPAFTYSPVYVTFALQ